MKDLLERHAATISEEEAAKVWTEIRRRAVDSDGIARARRRSRLAWGGVTLAATGAAVMLFLTPREEHPVQSSPDRAQVEAAPKEAVAEPEPLTLGPALPALDTAEPIIPATGMIAGQLTDTGGHPIAYGSVIVKGTELVALSGRDGRFTITQVPAGKHDLVARYVGREPATRSGVKVTAGRRTRVDVVMDDRMIAVKEVEIVAAKNKIDVESSTTERSFNAGEANVRIVHNVEDALAKRAGVVESGGQLLVRGGRNDETKYYVDGVPVTDPLAAGEKGASRSAPQAAPPARAPAPPSAPPRAPYPFPPSHGGSTTVNGAPADAMFFKGHGTNPYIVTSEDPLSTFALDVDTGSYTLCRQYLRGGSLPPGDAVRVEEFLNFFPHDYPAPRTEALAIHLEAAPSPFGPGGSVLLRVGLKARDLAADGPRKRANLVFVIDTSGSMAGGGRLEMVKRALIALVDELDAQDRIGVVIFHTTAWVVLHSTPLLDRDRIIEVVSRLQPDGSTNAEAGLRLGYEMADQEFDPNAVNRVILCSDGVANTGVTSASGILETIHNSARRGIYLTTVGVGMGNYNDALLEELADRGDGHYHYVDDMKEAHRIFLENLTGTLQAVARDAKIQVEFDPRVVDRYRLIGYENRDVADRDFRNDRVDAGEIGSGHEVTALYELHPAGRDRGKDATLATVRLRWEEPAGGKVHEISARARVGGIGRNPGDASWSFRRDAAVTEFAEILGRSFWAKDSSPADVLPLLEHVADDASADEETRELLELVRSAAALWPVPETENRWRPPSAREGAGEAAVHGK